MHRAQTMSVFTHSGPMADILDRGLAPAQAEEKLNVASGISWPLDTPKVQILLFMQDKNFKHPHLPKHLTLKILLMYEQPFIQHRKPIYIADFFVKAPCPVTTRKPTKNKTPTMRNFLRTFTNTKSVSDSLNS